MADFTPGPWAVHSTSQPPDVYSVARPPIGGDIICEAPVRWPLSMCRWEANARVIAALPDLLASLKECADDLAALIEDQYQQTKDHPAMKSRYDRDMAPVIAARAIIAKATGQRTPEPAS